MPLVAIVGRPNVGKSTLFNRLLGRPKAIVDDLPGLTRDRNYGEARWAGRRFRLVDTGGIESVAGGDLEANVQAQSRLALKEADAVIFLFDGKNGLNPLDRDIVDELRQAEKPVYFAVNKLDSRQRADQLYEFYAFGIERLYSISAEHGLGIAELMDDVVRDFPPVLDEEDETRRAEAKEAAAPARIAVVGRPNVGKSTLINRLLGFERSVVHAAPGTTRDSLDTPFELFGEPCVLIDTAGIRRKARIDQRIERFSVSRSLRAVERGDLIVHVIDGPEGVTDQDAQILRYAVERAKAILLAVNKWDLVSKSGGEAEKYREEVRYRLAFLEFAPIVLIAAATGYGVGKLLETAARLLKVYSRRVPTSSVNQALHKIVRAHGAPLFRGKAVKFFYATQTGTRPPTLTIFVNLNHAIPDSYRRYLTAQLRRQLGFDDAPLRLIFRARREPSRGKRA